MFQWFRNLVNGSNGVVEQPEMAMAYTAPVETITETAPTEYSRTAEAEKTLAIMLRNSAVEHQGRAGMEKKNFPVGRIAIGESLINRQHYEMGHARSASLALENDDATARGENLMISVELTSPITDFNKASISKSLQHIVTKIPSLAGQIHVNEPKKVVSYGEVWKQLKHVLAANPSALTAHEVAMIDTFFAANTAKFDEPLGQWNESITTSHSDGLVYTRINAKELPQDKNAVKSTDEEILGYFKQHHDEILSKVKEKALALGVLKAGDLDKLDMYATANGWDISLNFGTKPLTDIDPATQQKLTPAELAKKMTETPLASVDTKKLSALMSEAVLECGKELPSITPRILDAHMLGTILRHRLGKDTALEAVLSHHDMFKTEDEVKEEAKARANHGKIELGEPSYGSSISGRPVAELSFTLPVGMKVDQVIQELATNRSQLLLSSQQQAGVGIAA